MKIKVCNLIVETTRKCNVCCAHCLRGNAQNKDIRKEVIDKILDTFEISSIVFTGGEPSLNIEAINYFREGLEKRNLGINDFYIVTNGKSNQEELALATLRLIPQDSYKAWVKIGRAKENGIGYDYPFLISKSFDDIVTIEDKETVIVEELYVTVDGLLYFSCDFDYKTVDKNNFGIINDLIKYSEKACEIFAK